MLLFVQGRQDDPGQHQVCNHNIPLDARLTNAAVYTYVMPSYKSLQLPGCVDALPALAEQGKRVLVWIIDTPRQLDALQSLSYEYATGAISNAPFVIAPHCEQAVHVAT